MNATHHQVECELLQLCSRARLDETAVARIKELSRENPDWDYLYQLARRHALLPMLFHHLNLAGGNLVPADFLKRLKLIYQENAARNLVLTDELLSIVRELRANEIDSLPFKGPTLAKIAYGDLALRCFADLDLIVHRRNVAAAREILITRGYRPSKELSPQQEQLLLASQHNIQFTGDDGRLIVELHWRVAPDLYSPSVNEERVWGNLETITIHGVEVKTLPPEELILSLCVHGSRHLWERLSWISDVAALISRRPKIDWERLISLAAGNGSEGMLFLGLQLAGDVCAAPLPVHVKQRIATDGAISKLTAEIVELLFNGPESVRLNAYRTFYYNLRVRKNWSARARYCAFAVSPSDDDLGAIALPRVLNFVYYLLRPIRLLGRRRRKRSSMAEGAVTTTSRLPQ